MKSLSFSGYHNIKVIIPENNLQEILTLKLTNITIESLFWLKRLKQFEKISRNFLSNEIILFCDA